MENYDDCANGFEDGYNWFEEIDNDHEFHEEMMLDMKNRAIDINNII